MFLGEYDQYAYYRFEPRPDQPERYDQQTAFFNSRDPGVSILLGGNGSGTTTCALAKAVEFMIRTPAPRRDTPFWIIGPTYKQVMGACWDEKLQQQGHLPPHTVEWSRIHWYKPNQHWPYSVPLVPLHGEPGKNWTIKFKSYEEGIFGMSAESIGGFMFTEQFPWSLLTEVLRGTREYTFFGNKIIEATPIDPHLFLPLQEMEEEDKLPEGWKIYRANTECAYEAGHVTQQFWDTWFGMLPDSIRDVRTKGLWGGYEGLIYPDFNVHVHCLPDDWELPPGLTHRRMIDWGSGPNNAFACLFAARDGAGVWYIYNEYYSTDVTRDTIMHLCQIQDMVYWPPHNPNYGVTWADPSSPDRFRIAGQLPMYAQGYEPMNIQAANNSVNEGIEYIQYLLKPDPSLALPSDSDRWNIVDQLRRPKPRPRLLIHKKNCPNLVKEMRAYQWMKQPVISLNAKNARMEPMKIFDHAVDALRYGMFSEASQYGMTPKGISKKHQQTDMGSRPKKRPIHMRRMT